MAFRRFAVASAIEAFQPSSGTGKIQVKADSGAPVTLDYDPTNFVYFRCRAITADTPNGNGDMFPVDELKKAYKSFIGVGLYKDHDSDSVSKSIGQVLWAEWVPEGNYVECYCAVDRKLAPEMARRVETGAANTVSMGCMVGEATCSECKNVAHNQLELCEHMMPGRGIKGKKNQAGKPVFEINKMLQFTELSLVTVPADPTAKIFEVFAGLQNGTITIDQFRDFIREEVKSAVAMSTASTLLSIPSINLSPAVFSGGNLNTASNGITSITTWVGPTTTSGFVTSAPAEVPRSTEAVAKVLNNAEENMKLTISYQKGTNLANSFFVGKEGDSEFKVAIAEVMPLRVQESIKAREPGVATPEQVITDLSAKCDSLSAFKAWAKKRKKKNKKALEKMEKTDAPAADAPKAEASPAAIADAPAPAAAAPAAAPSASTEVLNPAAISDAPAADAGDLADAPDSAAAPEGAGDNVSSVEEVTEAIKMLQEKLDQMKNSSSKKTAVKTQENVTDKRDNGASNGKPSPAKSPAAMQEISKTENPKGHMDKGASLVKTAAEGSAPVWSVNPKELEKLPAAPKPAQASPAIVSWNGKEMASEQVKPEKGGNAGAKVKKFFGRLPAGGLGEAPHALDMKSGVDPEKEMLKRALDQANAEKDALKQKEQLQQIADKIFEIVTALREKNMLTAGSEDALIEHLSASFKDLAQLDNVLGLVSKLSATAESAAEPTATTDEVEVGNVVPQVFEPISQTEDAISTMAKIWNL